MISTMNADEWTYPPRDYVPVTPSDSAPLPFTARGLYCTADGDVVFRCIDSDVDRTLPLTAGQYLFGFFKDVKEATTATVHAVK